MGQKAIEGFLKNCNPEAEKTILMFKDAFLLGCILHDLGHAPFSHTCEDLYNYQDKITHKTCLLNGQLFTLYSKCVGSDVFESFKNDYCYILKSTDGICKAPSEHEVMSAILTIENFSKFKNNFSKDANLDLDLTIRSILGCVFAVKRTDSEEEKRVRGIKNCLIRLLNSPTVDVDKLDYIARDTQMSGYDNVVLDNERLLDSICFAVNEDGVCFPAFRKSAISIISNVILAKNLQARWIVNHPVVLYDAYLLRRAIGISIKCMFDKECAMLAGISSFDMLVNRIFSHEALSKDGIVLNDRHIALLSDIELLSWMKQNISNKEVSEYFSRDERKSPIWKSNEEFLFYLNSDEEKAIAVSSFMAPLLTYLSEIEDLYSAKKINRDLAYKIEEEDVDGKEELLEILEILNSYTDEQGNSSFEYVILPAKSSFFAKINAKHIYIRFGDDEHQYTDYHSIKEESPEVNRKKYEFFYLYSSGKIEARHFLRYLYNKINDSYEIRT